MQGLVSSNLEAGEDKSEQKEKMVAAKGPQSDRKKPKPVGQVLAPK